MRRYYSQKPEDYMINQDLLENDDIDTILLVEGAFDANSIDGVGVMKNNLSEKQINLLKWSGKRIILIPDRNRAGGKLVDQCIDNDFEVSIPDWDREVDDCAEATKRYGKLFTVEGIMENAQSFVGLSKLQIKTRLSKFGLSYAIK